MTGVQTCALPIFGEGEAKQRTVRTIAPDRPLIVFDLFRRSNRRLGCDEARGGVAGNRLGEIEIDLLRCAGVEIDHPLGQRRASQPQRRRSNLRLGLRRPGR